MAGFNHTLSAILRGRWLIDAQWAQDHIPMVLNIVKGNPLPASNTIERKAFEGIERPFAIDPVTGERQEFFFFDGEKLVKNKNLAQNSVAILPIHGPITKYDGECGETGSITYNTHLLSFKKSPNIGSVVLLLDTPGGEARAAHDVVNTIKNLGKPVLSYVDGMAASLGVWYTSASKEVYLSSPTDQIGSVGSYVTLFDFRGMLELSGIKMHEIYAPQSTDKNKNYRDALDGNYDAIKKDLAIHVDQFISFVKDNRGERATAKAAEWNSGKMFYAKEAIANGLADGVASFEKVVSKAAWLALRNK